MSTPKHLRGRRRNGRPYIVCTPPDGTWHTDMKTPAGVIHDTKKATMMLATPACTVFSRMINRSTWRYTINTALRTTAKHKHLHGTSTIFKLGRICTDDCCLCCIVFHVGSGEMENATSGMQRERSFHAGHSVNYCAAMHMAMCYTRSKCRFQGTQDGSFQRRHPSHKRPGIWHRSSLHSREAATRSAVASTKQGHGDGIV